MAGLLLCLAYPLLVYVLLGRTGPVAFAGLLALMAVLRALSAGKRSGAWLQALLLLLFAGLLLLRGSVESLRYYPVAVNAAMLILFATSLLYPPTLIERLARLSDPELPAEGVRYTRRLTQVWCAFFVANGLAALWTARHASWEHWTLYNGLIAYVLMSALLTGEWLLRKRLLVRAGVA